MLTNHSIHGRRFVRRPRFSAGFAVLFFVVGLLAIGAPAAMASPGSANAGSVLVGAVPTKTQPTVAVSHVKHGMGALLPTKQVDPVRAFRMAAAEVPASVDLAAYSVPVGNQGTIGSCVAWAIDYAMLGWYSNRFNKPGQPFHPMYTYSQINSDDTKPDGGGSQPSAALNIARSQGNDTVGHYSRSLYDFINEPNASERANAANWKISGYTTLFANTDGKGNGTAGSTQIKSALASGKPVAITMQVRDGFTTVSTASNTLWDNITSPITGAHEVLATGYDQYGLIIQNSWGTTWGYKGYGRLSWRVVGNDVYQAHTIDGFASSTPAADTTPPVMSAVGQQFPLGQEITSTQAPVQFSWSATDAAGVTGYQVWWSTDNGANWTQDTSVTATATSIVRWLAFGGTYKYAVRARDAAGNWSPYSYSNPVTPGVTDDSALPIVSPWARYSLTGTHGGSYSAASQAGAYFQYTFTGRDVALVAPKFSTAGRATLYCDGTSYGLIDTYSQSTIVRQTVAWCHFPQSGQHTMRIVLQGTSGRPWFGVDAFAVLR
jgi:C1A family cysteine protease